MTDEHEYEIDPNDALEEVPPPDDVDVPHDDERGIGFDEETIFAERDEEPPAPKSKKPETPEEFRAYHEETYRLCLEQEREISKVIDLPGYKTVKEQKAEREAAEAAKNNRWCVPLSTFLGDEEPDADDSVDWIIRDIIPRAEPALFVGRAKGGKTYAMLDLAISIAMGLPWLGESGFENTLRAPARVQVIALEDSTRRLRQRVWELCRARGFSPNDKTLLANLCISRAPLRLPDRQDQKDIERELKAWKPAAVFLDNLTRVMAGDPNKTQDAALFCTLWIKQTAEIGSSFTYLHHIRKEDAPTRGKGDPFDKIRGSGAFVDAARNIVLTIPLDEKDRALSEVRMRGNLELRRPPFVLEFTREPRGDRFAACLADRGAAEVAIVDMRQKRQEAKRKEKATETADVFESRRNAAMEIARRIGKVSSRSLAAALNLSEGTCRPVISSLAEGGALVRDGNNGYAIPKDEEVRNPQIELPA